jgi:hypothetical protein
MRMQACWGSHMQQQPEGAPMPTGPYAVCHVLLLQALVFIVDASNASSMPQAAAALEAVVGHQETKVSCCCFHCCYCVPVVSAASATGQVSSSMAWLTAQHDVAAGQPGTRAAGTATSIQITSLCKLFLKGPVQQA